MSAACAGAHPASLARHRLRLADGRQRDRAAGAVLRLGVSRPRSPPRARPRRARGWRPSGGWCRPARWPRPRTCRTASSAARARRPRPRRRRRRRLRRAVVSSRRNRTTVMLSRPPAALAAAIRPRPGPSRLAARSRTGAHARLADHRREAVGAHQEDVAGAGVEDLVVDLHLGLGAERAGDDRALRMGLGLLLGQLAARHQLADERVVAGQPRRARRRARGRRGGRRRGPARPRRSPT